MTCWAAGALFAFGIGLGAWIVNHRAGLVDLLVRTPYFEQVDERGRRRLVVVVVVYGAALVLVSALLLGALFQSGC